MVSRSLKFKLVALLIATAALVLTLACGDDEPAEPTPDIAGAVLDALQSAQASQPSGEQMTAQIQKSVQDAIEATQASQPSTEQLAAQIQQSVQGAVQAIQASQPSAEQLAAQIQKSVEEAVATAPQGMTAADVQSAVEASIRQATAGQLTAAQVQSIVDRSISSLPAPEIDVGQIQGLIESAVRANVPEGTSAEEIQQLVSAALTAATANAATRGDIETLVSESIMEAAADQLTAADVQRIIGASLAATNVAIENATMAAKEAQAAAERAVEQTAAVETLVGGLVPKPVGLREFETGEGEFHSFVWDGAVPTTFNEAPELSALVSEGLLPPVTERLPKEPLVIKPAEEIGKYGGTWRRAFTGPADGQNVDRIQHDLVIEDDNDAFTPVPNIAKGWEHNADFTEWTIFLREGMKWSDGQPFTVEDFVFAHEDQTANSELQPTLRWAALKDPVTDELVPLVKIDDYSFKYVFSGSKPRFLEQYNGSQGGMSLFGRLGGGYYAPAHYMKQFHPKYADAADLDQKIKEHGFDSWVQLYKNQGNPLVNTDLPVVSPWKVVNPITDQVYVAERNPYYFVVDPEGNQLPYLDRLTMFLAANTEVLNLRAIAGELDMQARHIKVAKIPVLKDSAEDGNYEVRIYSAARAVTGVTFNQTYDADPELAKWIQNRDFRIAISHAIDREAINEIVFLGIGEPSNGCNPLSIYAPPKDVCEEYDSYGIRDVAKANQLLDSIGLTAKDSSGFRLRSDGNGRLALPLSYTDAFTDNTAVGEIVIENLRQVGIGASLDVLERGLYSTRRDNNELAIHFGSSPQHYSEIFGSSSNPFGTYHAWLTGPLYSLHYETNGAEGLEPTGDVLRLRQIWEEGNNLPLELRIPLGQEAVAINMKNVWQLGFVGSVPCGRCVLVKKNNFRNVPRVTSLDGNWPGEARPEQFFIE